MPTRIFVADQREHPDPDPNLTPEQVRDMFAAMLPDLANATWQEHPDPDPESDLVRIVFTRRVGTKGRGAR
jgi:PRTRC genetic system protein C